MPNWSRSVSQVVALGVLCPATASAQPSAAGPSRTPALSPETVALVSLGGIVFSALVAALLIYTAPEFTLSTVAHVRTDPVETAVVGFVSLIAAFVLTVILVFTVVGAVLAIPLASAVALALIPGIVVTEIALGRELCEVLGSERTADAPKTLWLWFAVGAAVVTLLGAIPVLNFLAISAVWALAVGAIIQHVRTDADGEPDAASDDVESGTHEEESERHSRERYGRFGRRRDGDASEK